MATAMATSANPMITVGEVGGDRARKLVDRLRGQHLVEGVEADERNQRDGPDQQCARIAELGPRLNHLRQPELRPLRRVERHEERSERTSGQDGDGSPEQIAAERDPQDADGQCREVGISREPDRPEVPDFPVALGERHIVDRTLLDESEPLARPVRLACRWHRLPHFFIIL